jgi:hypothetical protein
VVAVRGYGGKLAHPVKAPTTLYGGSLKSPHLYRIVHHSRDDLVKSAFSKKVIDLPNHDFMDKVWCRATSRQSLSAGSTFCSVITSDIVIQIV